VVPPLVGVAVKVTGVPEQIVLADATTEILTGNPAVTVMVLSAIALHPVPVTTTVKRNITVPKKLEFGVNVTADGFVVAVVELRVPDPEIIDHAAPVLLPPL
jgi:hypothetical protein